MESNGLLSLEYLDVFVDACPAGIGAYFLGRVYYAPMPLRYQLTLTIVHMEMLNTVVAFRVWGQFWRDKKIRVHCDNAAVVSVLNSGASRDPFLSACARTLWLLKAKYNVHMEVQHIRGSLNTYADTLSRWPGFSNSTSAVVKHLKKCEWHVVNETLLEPDFSV